MLPYQQEMVVLQGQAIGKYYHYYINHSLNLSSLVSSPFSPLSISSHPFLSPPPPSPPPLSPPPLPPSYFRHIGDIS